MSNSLDTLLDTQLDDLADLPSFGPFPPGVHLCTMGWEQKSIGDDKAGYEIQLTAIETIEAKEPGQVASKGQKSSALFFLKHPNPKAVELGAGKMKALCADISNHFGGGMTLRDCIEKSEGLEVLVTTSMQVEKKEGKPTGREFLRVDGLAVK